MRRAEWCGCGIISLAVGLLLPGCMPAADPASLPAALNVASGLQAEYVLVDAVHPTALAFASDGRVFYTEKDTGRIRIVKDGELLAEPFARVPVNSAGDRGLLGIALHPDFEFNGRVYVFYTRSDTGANNTDARAVVDNRVVYFTASADVAPAGEVFVASLPVGSHTGRVGGRIAFGLDDTLFVALGDLGNEDLAQDEESLAGKILRYNDDGTIPADNPTPESPVFALGLREPRGLAIDPETGDPWVTERSQNGLHEINRIAAGKNYGWPTVVGPADTEAELAFAAANADYVDPLADSGIEQSEYVGAAFNPNTKYGPKQQLRLFYGVAGDGRVVSLQLGPERTSVASSSTFATGLPWPITDVAFTPVGTLYVATEDALLRVVRFEQ